MCSYLPPSTAPRVPHPPRFVSWSGSAATPPNASPREGIAWTRLSGPPSASRRVRGIADQGSAGAADAEAVRGGLENSGKWRPWFPAWPWSDVNGPDRYGSSCIRPITGVWLGGM